MEYILGVVDDVGGHAGEGNMQTAEVDRVIVGFRQRIEQRVDVLSEDNTTAHV